MMCIAQSRDRTDACSILQFQQTRYPLLTIRKVCLWLSISITYLNSMLYSLHIAMYYEIYLRSNQLRNPEYQSSLKFIQVKEALKKLKIEDI